jgi:hypothetical protein
VIVNRQDTALDKVATVKAYANVDEFMRRLTAALGVEVVPWSPAVTEAAVAASRAVAGTAGAALPADSAAPRIIGSVAAIPAAARAAAASTTTSPVASGGGAGGASRPSAPVTDVETDDPSTLGALGRLLGGMFSAAAGGKAASPAAAGGKAGGT